MNGPIWVHGRSGATRPTAKWLGGLLLLSAIAVGGCQSSDRVSLPGASSSQLSPSPAYSPSLVLDTDSSRCPAAGVELPVATRGLMEQFVGSDILVCGPGESSPSSGRVEPVHAAIYPFDGVDLPATLEDFGDSPGPDSHDPSCTALEGTVSMFLDGAWRIGRNADCWQNP